MELDPTNAKKLYLHQASYAYSLLDRFAEYVEGEKTVTTPAIHDTVGVGAPPVKTEFTQKEAR